MDPDPWSKIAKLSKSDINMMQDAKLRDFIQHQVYPYSPHYRKVFDDNNISPNDINTVKDLARVPFTSKKDFLDEEVGSKKYREFVLQPDKDKIKQFAPLGKKLSLLKQKLFQGQEQVEFDLAREYRPVLMTFTTGTTQTPVPFLYTNYDVTNLHLSGARMMASFGVEPGETVVNMFPFAPHLAFWQVVFGGIAANVLALSTGGGKTLGTKGNITAIEKVQPTMILGVPSYVYHLLREAKAMNCKMPYIKKVVLGASRCTSAFKMRLVELLEGMGASNVAVFGTYGFTEARCAWSECPTSPEKSSGYFLYPDKEIFEIIDPKTGEVKGEGEDGEIVYTGIDARGSVVLRYRTGDFARGGITYGECPTTGRTVGRLSSDITRLSDIKDLRLSKVKGSLVNFSLFPEIFAEIPTVAEWQLEIGKKDNDPFEMDVINVYVCGKGQFEQDALRDEVQKKIFMTTELRPNSIHFVTMEEMVKRLGLETENKDRRIVDNRPSD